MQADADDSAKATLSLNLLGRTVGVDSLLERFRSKDNHFCTYADERDASFSANCNVLRAILEAPNVDSYVGDIESVANFLCESWWKGAIRDKWASQRQVRES